MSSIERKVLRKVMPRRIVLTPKEDLLPALEQVEQSTTKTSDPDETREAFLVRMEAEGFVIVEPKPYQLQVDIDCKEHMDAFLRSMGILQREYPGTHWHSQASKSGVVGREHITVFLPWEVSSPWERIAWQAALGSDPVREVLSCLRHYRGDPTPTLFAERKGTPDAR